MERKYNYTLGICCKITNSFLFVLITLLLSLGSVNVPVSQLFFLVSVLATIFSFLAIKFFIRNVEITVQNGMGKFYIGRASVAFISTITWIYAISGLGFNEATAMGYTSSFWLVLLAPIFCGESIKKSIIVVLLSNTIGVLLILNLDPGKMTWGGVGLAIFTTFLWALYDIMCKKQTKSVHYLLQAFFVHLVSAIISAPVALTVWQPIPMEYIFWIVLVSLLTLANLVVLFLSYSNAPVTIVMPFGYLRLIFAIIFSYLLKDVIPSWGCVCGAALIVTSDVVFYLIHTRRSGRRVNFTNIEKENLSSI